MILTVEQCLLRNKLISDSMHVPNPDPVPPLYFLYFGIFIKLIPAIE